MITRDEIQELFDRIASTSEDQPEGWNMAGPMTWGHFFTHSTPEPLYRAAADLQRHGYTLIDIRLSDKDEPSEHDLWWLHVEIVETHNADTLFARCERLQELASSLGLDAYDGFDVGPQSERPPLSN